MTLSQQDLLAFERQLKQMLAEDIDLSARSCVRRGLVKNPSDITRIPARRDILEKYRNFQRERRSKNDDRRKVKQLKKELEGARKEIKELGEQQQMLIASHRAMIAIIGEYGGMAAWRSFFGEYEKALTFLETASGLRHASDPAKRKSATKVQRLSAEHD
ncbi:MULTISPECIES: hypothetical protein [Thalassospira]|uniref:Phage protein n=1 Tax=Thalassospira aquimaris TaxID=3037796 RepID=A0ABT6GCA2_9PROT|nr:MULTISPECIES: hypothetical protein [Thalassospira]MDG4719712.1 hypothetical protein [Thalassospira sp. FZY0004]